MSEDIDMLFEKCRNGDVRAQEKVYKFFYPQMIKVCCRYSGNLDDAGIIYNNAFLKIFKASKPYKNEGRLTYWVKRIITHTAIDYVRSKQTIVAKTVYNLEVEDFGLAPSVLSKLTAKDIFEFIQSLPKATATVFNMFIYEDYPHKEIAEILNISEGTSKWHVNEAKRLLKQRIDSLKSITSDESTR